MFGVAGFMAFGGGFFHDEILPNNVTRTVTYTLYKSLPPPPEGPRFCPAVTAGGYGLMLPCDYKPPFVWWLQRKMGQPKTASPFLSLTFPAASSFTAAG